MEQRNLKKEDWYNALFAGIVVLIIFVPPIVQELKKKPSNANEQVSQLIDETQASNPEDDASYTFCFPEDEETNSFSSYESTKPAKVKYHYTLDVTTNLEDQEYLEVEQFNGKYYVVNVDGYDDSYYEFDSDEELEDAIEIYEYAKRNHIKPIKRN